MNKANSSLDQTRNVCAIGNVITDEVKNTGDYLSIIIAEDELTTSEGDLPLCISLE